MKKKAFQQFDNSKVEKKQLKKIKGGIEDGPGQDKDIWS